MNCLPSLPVTVLSGLVEVALVLETPSFTVLEDFSINTEAYLCGHTLVFITIASQSQVILDPTHDKGDKVDLVVSCSGPEYTDFAMVEL